MNNLVGVVIVTYGERHTYLEETIPKLNKLGVGRIFLVLNGVSEISHQKISYLENQYSELEVIDLEKNEGSAYGYMKGLEYGLNESNLKYFWLLDDDNLPGDLSLERLLNYWEANTLDNCRTSSALLSYRADRAIYKKAIQIHEPYLMLGDPNAFFGFHFYTYIEKLFTSDKKRSDVVESGQVAVAPYGGLFFHKDLLAEIGLPDTRYFLYGDDYEFSYRITKTGGRIILLLDSVTDLETSFHLTKSKFIKNKFFKTDSEIRILYSARNGIWFEKRNLVKNSLIYYLNGLLYSLLLFFTLVLYPKKLKNYVLYLKGVFCGVASWKNQKDCLHIK